MIFEHTPIMVAPILEHFSLSSEKASENKNDSCSFFADLTLGGAGHTSAILEKIPNSFVLGMDQDTSALNHSTHKLESYPQRTKLVHANFSEFSRFMDHVQVFHKRRTGKSFTGFKGILLDIGVSSHQLDFAQRGMSFTKEGPLDMRMNQNSNGLTAFDIIHRYDEKKLAHIFEAYGEIPYAKPLAAAIVTARKNQPINTTLELEEIIYKSSPGWAKRKRIHPATCVFQALRIEVNDELEVLKKVLVEIPRYLCVNGVCAVITFHSLEDRIVKHTFKSLCMNEDEDEDKNFQLQVMHKKPIIPDDQEIKLNPRSRSAKLRFLQRLS